ncbi:MAG TPA: zinc-dependent alcohol dehydrogenase family protein [Burkholderiaceae bacterium]|nr:zinc-dependent alcohol dehydrogenase family protein [Burkholderiaceae bacterium]
MRAMVLAKPGEALREAVVGVPKCGPKEILLQVHACGVCRTDLHILDGELPDPKIPLIPGHEVVGTVFARGSEVERFAIGQRIGVPWLGWTCGQCRFCLSGRENLCERARFTGYTRDGGYSQFAIADERFCFDLPATYADAEVAPLLCAGLIGYRALVAAGDATTIGIYGFGAAAHIVSQVARQQGRTIFAFTRPGDVQRQEFAKELGAAWAGDSTQSPPEPLDAALLFAPDGSLVPQALRQTAKGGTVVCAGIHMSDIPSFAYSILWGERVVRSVANLTRRDGEEFFNFARRYKIQTTIEEFPLHAANDALERLRTGSIRGAAVLMP